MKWITDEHGNRTAELEGWTFKLWSFGDVVCTGPDGEDLDYDEDNNTLMILHDAPYEGAVGVTVPCKVLEKYLALAREFA